MHFQLDRSRKNDVSDFWMISSLNVLGDRATQCCKTLAIRFWAGVSVSSFHISSLVDVSEHSDEANPESRELRKPNSCRFFASSSSVANSFIKLSEFSLSVSSLISSRISSKYLTSPADFLPLRLSLADLFERPLVRRRIVPNSYGRRTEDESLVPFQSGSFRLSISQIVRNFFRSKRGFVYKRQASKTETAIFLKN